MKPNSITFMYFLAYFVLFGTWAGIVLTEHARDSGSESLVQYIQLTLASLTGHVLTMIQPSVPDANASPVDKEAGKSDPWLLMILAGMAALALAGCTTVAQQALVGAESAAVTSAKAVHDNEIFLWTTAACATPYSAAIRNPSIIPALKALCLPSGAQAAPATMFDGVPSLPSDGSVPK